MPSSDPSDTDQPTPAPRLAEVVEVLERDYPTAGAESWDAVGLVCGDPQRAVRKVLLAVDPVEAVVDEALAWGADLVLVHHPLLLRGVHSVAATTPKGRVVHRLVEAGSALYVAHTNADSARPGVSDALARYVGLDELRPLVPAPGPDRLALVTFVPAGAVDDVLAAAAAAGAVRSPSAPAGAAGAGGTTSAARLERLEMSLPTSDRDAVLAAVRAAHPVGEPVVHLVPLVPTGDGSGLGRVGVLAQPTTLERFALAVAEALPHTPQGVRVSGDLDAQVRTVAVCGGSGDTLFDAVRASGADVFLTADLRHHPASEAREAAAGGTPYLVDVAHWASEWPWLHGCADGLHRGLEPLGTSVETRVSVTCTDPWTLRLSSSGGVVR